MRGGRGATGRRLRGDACRPDMLHSRAVPPMAQRIPIARPVANALQWLGTLYGNPADALRVRE